MTSALGFHLRWGFSGLPSFRGRSFFKAASESSFGIEFSLLKRSRMTVAVGAEGITQKARPTGQPSRFCLRGSLPRERCPPRKRVVHKFCPKVSCPRIVDRPADPFRSHEPRGLTAGPPPPRDAPASRDRRDAQDIRDESSADCAQSGHSSGTDRRPTRAYRFVSYRPPASNRSRILSQPGIVSVWKYILT
ncbi:hypothetical protein KM043_017996 [Ampulex compressa]|nr:hypothetical protein KM043_017996 [Ampulex compressa]